MHVAFLNIDVWGFSEKLWNTAWSMNSFLGALLQLDYFWVI